MRVHDISGIHWLRIELFIVLLSMTGIISATAETTTYPATRIWDQAPHNPFTDLLFAHGRFYCTFREGDGHVGGSGGRIRVITSTDGTAWENAALIVKAGVDLRDPKLELTPDDRVMVLLGGSTYEGKKMVHRQMYAVFSDTEGDTFSELTPITLDEQISSKHDWLWRITWHKGTAYGVVYQSYGQGKSNLHLVKSTDGLTFDLLKTLDAPGKPNEATIRFTKDDEMLILVRRAGDKPNALFGRSKAPYTDWAWTDTGYQVGGPDFIVKEDGTIIASGRDYQKKNHRTALWNLDESDHLIKLGEFPSGGDTSYPGMVIKEGKLYVSYYASHEGKTAIYLSVVDVSEL